MTSNQTGRQPAGVPTGGQFAPTTHAESDVVLDDVRDDQAPTFVVEHEHEGNIFETIGTAEQCATRQAELNAQSIPSSITVLTGSMTEREFEAVDAQRDARDRLRAAHVEFERLTANTIRDLVRARHPEAESLTLISHGQHGTGRSYSVGSVLDADGNSIDTQWDNGRDDTLDMLMSDIDAADGGWLDSTLDADMTLPLTHPF